MWLTLPAATQWGWHINKQMDICMHDLAVRVPTHFSNWDRQMKDTAIRKLSNRVGVTIKSCQVLTAGDELVHDHELCAVAWMRAACVRKWRAIIRNRASWSYSHTQYTRDFVRLWNSLERPHYMHQSPPKVSHRISIGPLVMCMHTYTVCIHTQLVVAVSSAKLLPGCTQ